jgi:Mn2+/Fe2+ NRAMP family transporter
VLVAAAATLAVNGQQPTLNTIGDLSNALTPFLGPQVGRAVFGAGVLGAGLVAAIVVSLASAWGLGEVAGYRRSLEFHPLQAPWFYAVYAICVIGGALLVGVDPNLISLNVGVQVMNALLLPLVLGFLIALALRALPRSARPRGLYLYVLVALTAITCALGVWGGLGSLWS